jgi:SAM-dependent methyltransferase
VNGFHRWFCRSSLWSRILKVHVVPWALEGVDLSADVLEVGPGYGASTDVLEPKCRTLTCVESDPDLAVRLRNRMDSSKAAVLCGDAAALELPDSMFDNAVCFMMLHHVTPAARQDRLFAEMMRVLRPGGIFAGADSPSGLLLSALHLFDKVSMIDPRSLRIRLTAAGFESVQVDVIRYAFAFGHASRFDTVARTGGDEFSVVLEVTSREDADRVACSLAELLKEPFELGTHMVSVGAKLESRYF